MENFMIYPFKRKIISLYCNGNNTQNIYLHEKNKNQKCAFGMSIHLFNLLMFMR